jgi:hypothetical protein
MPSTSPTRSSTGSRPKKRLAHSAKYVTAFNNVAKVKTRYEGLDGWSGSAPPTRITPSTIGKLTQLSCKPVTTPVEPLAASAVVKVAFPSDLNNMLHTGGMVQCQSAVSIANVYFGKAPITDFMDQKANGWWSSVPLFARSMLSPMTLCGVGTPKGGVCSDKVGLTLLTDDWGLSEDVETGTDNDQNKNRADQSVVNPHFYQLGRATYFALDNFPTLPSGSSIESSLESAASSFVSALESAVTKSLESQLQALALQLLAGSVSSSAGSVISALSSSISSAFSSSLSSAESTALSPITNYLNGIQDYIWQSLGGAITYKGASASWDDVVDPPGIGAPLREALGSAGSLLPPPLFDMTFQDYILEYEPEIPARGEGTPSAVGSGPCVPTGLSPTLTKSEGAYEQPSDTYPALQNKIPPQTAPNETISVDMNRTNFYLGLKQQTQ